MGLHVIAVTMRAIEIILVCCWIGGTFALYSLLCRHLKLSLILNQQAADEELSTYKLVQPSTNSPRGEWFRQLLEKRKYLQNGLLIVVLLGTCMVIGDGALTPALSGRTPAYGISTLITSVMLFFLPQYCYLSTFVLATSTSVAKF